MRQRDQRVRLTKDGRLGRKAGCLFDRAGCGEYRGIFLMRIKLEPNITVLDAVDL